MRSQINSVKYETDYRQVSDNLGKVLSKDN